MYTRCRLRLAIRIVIRTAKGAKANLPMPPKAYLVLRRYAYGALVQGSPQGRGRHHTSRAILIRLGRFLADPSGRPPLLGVYALLPLASVPFGSLLRAAFAVPNPNCTSQRRRFFQVWLPCRLPRPADHPVYFGTANFTSLSLSIQEFTA